jgi:hypothetical protein
MPIFLASQSSASARQRPLSIDAGRLSKHGPPRDRRALHEIGLLLELAGNPTGSTWSRAGSIYTTGSTWRGEGLLMARDVLKSCRSTSSDGPFAASA